MTQRITIESPACVGALQVVADQPGATTAEIAKRSGWSIVYVRSVLRLLRRHNKVRSRAVGYPHQLAWWLQ